MKIGKEIIKIEYLFIFSNVEVPHLLSVLELIKSLNMNLRFIGPNLDPQPLFIGTSKL